MTVQGKWSHCCGHRDREKLPLLSLALYVNSNGLAREQAEALLRGRFTAVNSLLEVMWASALR